jgi:rare lipoprotein A
LLQAVYSLFVFSHFYRKIGYSFVNDALERDVLKPFIVVAVSCLSLTLMLSDVSTALAQCGGASWYALRSRTASGERMNPSAMTAAHKTLKFGTKVRVTDSRSGKSVIVRINDRGPFVRGRIIDLSKGAARQLGIIGKGRTKVCVARAG